MYISKSNTFKTKYILDNDKTYHERDLQAVKFTITSMIIPLPILGPSFRKLPLQILGFGFIFRNDEKVAYLHERRWIGLLMRPHALLQQRVLSKFVLQDRNNFTDLPIAQSSASVPS